MKNIAIIGASYLQLPLIRKAKEMGLTTHVFAWKANDVGEKEADYFYPISIVEKEQILEKCKEIEIDGICSIASDLAIITVNYVAQNMGLTSNSLECTAKSTNKHLMRECFAKNNDPSCQSLLVESIDDLNNVNLHYPIIVKPLDRSGSRGITKLVSKDGLNDAIKSAKSEGFVKKSLVEEFIDGDEYSIECISYKGNHQFLQITKKYTTGAPNFIEIGHLEPAQISEELINKVKKVVFHALDSLQIEYGASHSEIKIDEDGNIRIIEIGGRMGGDFIGSNLVQLSTGYDFVKSVIDIALGNKPQEYLKKSNSYSLVYFVFNKKDLDKLNLLKCKYKSLIVDYSVDEKNIEEKVTDSSNRHGYCILKINEISLLEEVKEILYDTI